MLGETRTPVVPHLRGVERERARKKQIPIGKLLLTAILLSSAASLFAQGTVVFNTRGGGTSHVYAPLNSSDTVSIIGQGTNDAVPTGTTDYGGRMLIGALGTNGQYGAATTLASLLGAPGANAPESALVPGWIGAGVGDGTAVTFRTGSAASGIKAGVPTFSNIPDHAPVGTFQVVAWDNLSGLYTNWASASAAWQAGLIAAGRSPVFNLTNIGGSNTVPPFIFPGMESFNLYFVSTPPPSLSIAPDGGGGYYIRFTGRAGYSYRLQRAPSATGEWATGPSQTSPPSTLVEFHDLFPPPGKGFYRTIQP